MAKRSRLAHPKRGEVWLVSFDPTIGAEIKKTRPAIVLQNDIANRASPITVVAAITSQLEERMYPTEVLIEAPEAGLTVDSVALLNQIRSIDRPSAGSSSGYGAARDHDKSRARPHDKSRTSQSLNWLGI